MRSNPRQSFKRPTFAREVFKVDQLLTSMVPDGLYLFESEGGAAGVVLGGWVDEPASLAGGSAPYAVSLFVVRMPAARACLGQGSLR
jgi:hypothetical protein